MYASVYDAAVTVGMALTNVIAGSDDRTQISLTRVSNATCALRRASTQHKGPGWKLLQHIREVPFSKGLQSTLSKMDIAGTGTKCQSANNGSTERQGQTSSRCPFYRGGLSYRGVRQGRVDCILSVLLWSWRRLKNMVEIEITSEINFLS